MAESQVELFGLLCWVLELTLALVVVIIVIQWWLLLN